MTRPRRSVEATRTTAIGNGSSCAWSDETTPTRPGWSRRWRPSTGRSGRSEPGRLLAYGSQPTPELLLKGSQPLGSLQAGILTGDLPSIDDARRWAELE